MGGQGAKLSGLDLSSCMNPKNETRNMRHATITPGLPVFDPLSVHIRSRRISCRTSSRRRLGLEQQELLHDVLITEAALKRAMMAGLFRLSGCVAMILNLGGKLVRERL